MPETDLAHRPGVELVNVGSWSLISGSWSPNRTDILAAVEASRCPAVRRPKLKLGHLDPRFNTPEEPHLDGTPSLGWFDNLRASDDGNTLIGDQVALPWLSQVQAAAYPDRSVEGTHNARCALGHVHPFVITAVSLLGETPPGIPTLRSIKSIDDLPAALGVAASGEDLQDGESVQATVRAAAEPDAADDEPVHTGAMVALIPTAVDAERLAVDGGEPAGELHVTMAYLGDVADLGAQGQQDVIDAVSSAINGMPVIEADVFSVNVFNPASDNAPPDARDRDTCLVWGLSGDEIDAVHDMVGSVLIGLGSAEQHRPWHCHMTAQYTDDLSLIPSLAERIGPVTFDRVRLAFGDTVIDIPLLDDSEPVDPSEFSDDLQVPNILMPVAAASADKLREYWVHGKGALKIRWGEKNDFYRCVKQLGKFVTDPKGLCNTYHREALGVAPGQEHVSASAEPTVLPAAEPEQVTQHEEDPVSLSDDMRSRLGLADDADETAALAAIDELKTRAEKTPEPTPEMVAASAAATEEVERAKTAQALMNEELTKVRDELNVIKASAATTVKASFFQGLKGNGQLKPADEEVWAARYDRDPELVTEILSGRAPNSEVPVMASGTVGEPEPSGSDDAEWEKIVARIDAPTGKAV
jgi:hypothetical protein